MRFRFVLAVIGSVLLFGLPGLQAAREMERLGRGVVAVQQPDGKVFVSWPNAGQQGAPHLYQYHTDKPPAVHTDA
jgi:hypothetical protein